MDVALDTLALKLTVTPALIGGATLIGRRWGPAVSGWLVGIPFTSGPVVLFIALAHGGAFAAQVALGVLLGTVSQSCCALAYAHAARRRSWPAALLIGAVAFAAITVALRGVVVTAVAAFALAVACNATALIAMPRAAPARSAPATPARWDLPLRMAVATGLVLALTEFAGALGPRLTGLIAPYPLYATILALFAHRESGAPAAIAVMRGLLVGLFAFATFFVVVAAFVSRLGVLDAFAIALLATLALEAITLAGLRFAR